LNDYQSSTQTDQIGDANVSRVFTAGFASTDKIVTELVVETQNVIVVTEENSGYDVSDEDDNVEYGSNPLQGTSEETDGDDGEEGHKDGQDGKGKRNVDLTERRVSVMVELMHEPSKHTEEDDAEA